MEQSEFMAKLGLPYDDSPERNQRLIIENVAKLHDKIAAQHNIIKELNGKIYELKGEVTVLGLHEQKLQERLDAVIEVVGDDHLTERMVDDIGTEDIIDAWIRAKNTKQIDREVGQ